MASRRSRCGCPDLDASESIAGVGLHAASSDSWKHTTFDYDAFDLGAGRERGSGRGTWTCWPALAALPITRLTFRADKSRHDDVPRIAVHAGLIEEDRLAARTGERPEFLKRPGISVSTPSSARRWTRGSSRGRRITARRAGGRVAAPRRASSGPASRKDARKRRHRVVELGLVRPVRVDPDLVLRIGRRRRRRRSEARPSSARPDPRHVAQLHGSERAPWRRGSERAVLVPAARTVPLSVPPPSITKACISVAGVVALTRWVSWSAHAADTGHGVADAHDARGSESAAPCARVEASTRTYAAGSVRTELWGASSRSCTASIRDRDVDNIRRMAPQSCARRVSGRGDRGVLSHAEHLGCPRHAAEGRHFRLRQALRLRHACGLVRPAGLDGLEPKSVKKKLKQPSFAAGVHRDEVYAAQS